MATQIVTAIENRGRISHFCTPLIYYFDHPGSGLVYNFSCVCPVCLSVCLSVCLYVCMYVCMSM